MSTSEWVQVGDLADSISKDAFLLEPSDALFGRSWRFVFSDDEQLGLSFASDGSFACCGTLVGAPLDERAMQNTVTELRPGTFLVDLVLAGIERTSLSLVIDVDAGCCTAILGTLPQRDDAMTPMFDRVLADGVLTAVNVSIRHGVVSGGRIVHRPGSDLVGKRVQYAYSPHELYEHVYLNEKYYSWHCIEGIEKGLADTDLCHHITLADNFHLFVWREKIVPTLGVILIDLDRKKTSGKLLGYVDQHFAKISNTQIGAHVTLLNTTRYAQAPARP